MGNSLKDEAQELDREAASLATQSVSAFVAIGRVMSRMCDERERWRCLDDPRTGKPFESQEQWVIYRFRGQRSWAFKARNVYTSLHANVPDAVMESIEPGVLEVMSKRLPSSAVKKPEILQSAMTSTPADFRRDMKAIYPDHFVDDDVTWILHPTESQAELFDRVLLKVQAYYGDKGTMVSKECALEYLLTECEQQMRDTVNDDTEAVWGTGGSNGR